MRILVTGSQGFIGKNLLVHLRASHIEVLTFVRGDNLDNLAQLIAQADAVIHLAGENRPNDVTAFTTVNTDLTATVCQIIEAQQRPIPLLFASSSQAALENPYGASKRAGELAVEALAAKGNPTAIYRLPGVFGKWCKPNYNSVVATFCHNLTRGLSIQINNASSPLRLVYIDDVVRTFLQDLQAPWQGLRQGQVAPEYTLTLGELAEQLHAFQNCRENLIVERVGTDLTRALYATYVSYLPPERFAYQIPQYADPRGVFVEMLKTKDSGQFSFFTSHPGVTRGGHYHHSKTEKFLVIKGQARFGFRHILTGEQHEIITAGDDPQVVETVPGWTHDITNIGDDEMVVMLWANENFDRARPDTIPCKV